MANDRMVMDVEALLSWAVRSEWPKRLPMSDRTIMMMAINRMAYAPRASTALAEFPWDKLVAGLAQAGRGGHSDVMHRDALCIYEAVRDIDAAPLLHLRDFGIYLNAAEHAALKAGPGERVDMDVLASPFLNVERLSPLSLLLAHARMRSRPDWCEDGFARGYLLAESGGHPRWFVTRRQRRVVRVDGRRMVEWVESEMPGLDPASRRPMPDAWRKVVFSPSPAQVVRRRIEYHLWWLAIRQVARYLDNDIMAEHCCIMSQAIEMPWIKNS